MTPENIEKNIWDQIRTIIQIQVRVHQIGITTLAGLLTASFFIRKDLAEMLLLKAHEVLPLKYFVVGNCILWIVAGMFFLIAKWNRERLHYYAQQLKSLPDLFPNDNIILIPEFKWNPKIGYYYSSMLIAFPIIDIVIYTMRVYSVL